jgi:2-dehydro-3-deoxy-D-arabinonate dehydratase
MLMLYRTTHGPVIDHNGKQVLLETATWDDLMLIEQLEEWLLSAMSTERPLGKPLNIEHEALAPLVSQEIWAAGVTYYRSRDARMEEAKKAGGGSFYDRVYEAARPELFYKGNASRAVGHNQAVRIREDSKWNVPEPELTLVINSHGTIVGYTIGNDMSSRDIEGENPLYLPQAKVYNQSAAVGPGVLLTSTPLSRDTAISLRIERAGKTVFTGDTKLDQLKRDPKELVEYLFRDNGFPHGCLLMTGTGIVPDSPFTLEPGDAISISIAGIGTLKNHVVRGK